MVKSQIQECCDCVRFLQKIYGEKLIYNYVFKAMAWKYKDEKSEDYLKNTLPGNVSSNLSKLEARGILRSKENSEKNLEYWDPSIPLKKKDII